LNLILGTNCELFLIIEHTMIACSTMAGSTFEVTGITHGMRAKIAAIKGVTLTEEGGVTCQVIGELEPIGICGSGLIEGIDEMIRVGVVNNAAHVGALLALIDHHQLTKA